MSPLAQALYNVLAESYALQLKTLNYHWNVEGAQFKALHDLFEEQYRELIEANDDIAERIRALGFRVDASMSAFAKASNQTPPDSNATDEAMLADLFDSHTALVGTIKMAMELAEQADDQFSVDMMVERTGAHEKAAWMLRSSLPQSSRKDLAKPATYAA